MNMNTHTFGRHAGTKKNVIQFSPNLIRNLQSHYDELKQYMEVGNWNYEAAKVAILKSLLPPYKTSPLM